MPAASSNRVDWFELETTALRLPRSAAMRLMNCSTVVPVPMPTTSWRASHGSAACAARRLFSSVFVIVRSLAASQDQRTPETTVPAYAGTQSVLLFDPGTRHCCRVHRLQLLLLRCFLLGLLFCLSHDRSPVRVSPRSEYTHAH